MRTVSRSSSAECRQYPFCWILGLCCVSTLVGCGHNGLDRYEVSGKVTLDGKPVEAAVSFMPDASVGNSGPGSLAYAHQGNYCTEADRGVVGGPYRIMVTPVDLEPRNRPSFQPYELKTDLPKEDSVFDIDIPVR